MMTASSTPNSTHHCPLCVHSVVHPPEDSRRTSIIFLNMEGVMVVDGFDQSLHSQIRATWEKIFPANDRNDAEFDYEFTVARGRHLLALPLKNLHRLIEEVEKAGFRALVVISSLWRNDVTLQQLREEVFSPYPFSKYLCGKVAPKQYEQSPECKAGHDFSLTAKEKYGLDLKNKAVVVEYWLRDHGFDPNSANFIVIDDFDSGFKARFGDNRVIQSLVEEKHLEKARNCLISKP